MNTNQLKAKILDLAIRGKLVPQNPSDGNAADFLKKLHNISDNEIPFQIPENWCWCRLGQIADMNEEAHLDREKLSNVVDEKS